MPGLESRLRDMAHRAGLQKAPPVVHAYRLMSTLRYRGRWDEPVEFRGARFRIGKDLSLYPAVANGGFEQHELEHLLPLVDEDAVAWDVGGNVGIYAVLLARAASRGHVVSFEPVPESYARLTGNLQLNGVENVTVENLALSNRSGEASMRVHADAHGCDTLEVSAAAADSQAVSVTTMRGDEYAARSPHGFPDVIKIDVEGHEPEFFEGVWDQLTERRPTILMEVNTTAWVGADRVKVWRDLLARLLDLYDGGRWVEPSGVRRVRHIDTDVLGDHAYALLLTTRDP